MAFYSIMWSVFLASMIVCWLVAPLCSGVARKFDMVDSPGDRKIHSNVIPYGGGAALLFTMLIMLLGGFGVISFGRDYLPDSWRQFVDTHIMGLTDTGVIKPLIFLMAGAVIVFALGMIDDMKPLGPKLKLAVQFLAAVLAWWGGVRITLFVDSQLFSFCVTVVWIVGITNAFNLLDNMDGLSAGVGWIAGLFLMTIMGESHYFTATTLAIFSGSLAGFLPRNFAKPPRKLFMGDAGSLFIGYVLATLTIAGTYFEGKGYLHAVLMPLLVLGVPVFDTCSVLFIRWRNRAPLMQGDTNHLSHRLVRMGFSRIRAVQIIYLLSVILGLAALLLGKLDASGALNAFLIGFFTVLLMAALMGGEKPGNEK